MCYIMGILYEKGVKNIVKMSGKCIIIFENISIKNNIKEYIHK